MLIDAGLVLEGGGMRCVFTAGILDYLMKKELFFKNVYGVSGSACVSLNYVSGQIGRTKKTSIDYIEYEKLLSLRSYFKTGSLFNMDLLFNRLPNQIIPFDYEAFFKSDQRLIMSVTDMLTGEPVYYDDYNSGERLMEVCKCSNCFPFISPIQLLDSVPVLDGGMSDAIPVNRALHEHNKKIVVILTKQKGYRKKIKKNRLIALRYYRYPRFVKMVNNRPKTYNRILDHIERLEESNKIFTIYPQINPVGLAERKKEKLTKFYNHGYMYAEKIYPDIIKYLGIDEQTGGES